MFHVIPRLTIAISLVPGFACAGCAPAWREVKTETELREAIREGAPAIRLSGVINLLQPVEIRDAHELQIRGSGILRMAPEFRGIAAIRTRGGSNLTLGDFTIEGNRETATAARFGLPPSHVPFAAFYPRNGIVMEGGDHIRVENLRLREIPNFAVIVSAARHIRLTGVTVEDSGSLNSGGRNNTSGGILLEEGTSDFEVRHCVLRRVRGNALWTHSRGEPRSARGIVAGNTFSDIGRDAIQIGHATDIRVEGNSGERIGFPSGVVDAAGHGTPVALDTAGNVERTVYQDNRFRDVNGECINLDGFHDGQVRRNVCESTGPFENYPFAHEGIILGNSDPGMESRNIVIADNRILGTGYGGLYLIGTGHTISGNRFLLLNRSGCKGDATVARCNYALDQPDMLRSGIYLAAGASRKSETRGNHIRGNELSGFGISRWCIAAAPGVSLKDNDIEGNTCNEDSVKR